MKINKINSIPTIKSKLSKVKNIAFFANKSDEVTLSNTNFDKKILLQRGIIPQNQDLDLFFEDVSKKIFGYDNKDFSSALKNKEITLSTSAYNNILYPYSAAGVEFDKNKSDIYNLSKIDMNARSGLGVGINFSDFNNPAQEVLKVNDYLKFLEQKTKRPPAAIGLLDINHPNIVDFITLKDNADYKNWCMDLSVIIDDEFMEKLENNDKSAQKIYSTLLNSMEKSGEPGIIFSNNKNYLCDCCAAVPLKNNEKLTLGHINLSKFFENNKINYDKLKKDTEILSYALQKLDKNSYIGVLGYQDLLNQMNLKYDSPEAIEIIKPIMTVIQLTAHKYNLKTAISPTGVTSRFLKTTPSIEPDRSDYMAEILTAAEFQKYLDGNISKTFLLDKNSTAKDIDIIIKEARKNGLRGLTVYKNKD